MKDTNEKLIQWHPAFSAGIQIELQEYADKLLFENEHQITSKPLAADVMIIKLVEKIDSGIYYIVKDNGILPTQLIVTSELDYESNMWIAGLTNDMNDSDKADKLLKEYKVHKDNALYESVMNVVVRANNELFNGGNVMCEALDELYKDAIDARVNELSDKKAKDIAKDMAKDMAKDIVDKELSNKNEELAVLRAQVAELQKRIAQQ